MLLMTATLMTGIKSIFQIVTKNSAIVEIDSGRTR